MIPHPREDEVVNKLSHGTVPLNHTQSVPGSAARFSISRKVLEKGPPGCSAGDSNRVLIPLLPYIRQAGAFYPMSYATLQSVTPIPISYVLSYIWNML
jgi:hypothetical protein